MALLSSQDRAASGAEAATVAAASASNTRCAAFTQNTVPGRCPGTSSNTSINSVVPVNVMLTMGYGDWIIATATSNSGGRGIDYQPCYRNLAGVGCAMAFAEWA